MLNSSFNILQSTGAYNIFDDESVYLEEKNAAYLEIRENEIARLKNAYDFETVQGIRSIPVPCREVNGDSPTGRVEYYLRGKCFIGHCRAGHVQIAVECIRKAHSLMFVSDMIWKYDAYISGISWLHNIGAHKEAWEEEQRVDEHFKKEGFYPRFSLWDFSSPLKYFEWKKEIKKMEEERLRKRKLRHEYYLLQEKLPELCPKSLAGYSRMKNSNTKNYQKLTKIALQAGVQLD